MKLLAFERADAGHGIHRRHHAAERQAARQIPVRHQRLQDRGRIGQSTGLDDDAVERRARALVAPPQEVIKGLRQVGADLAAEAAGRQLDDAVFARFDELMVEPDLAELIDDDGGAREFRLAQQAAEQGRLAAAEEAGEHRNRDHIGADHDGTTGLIATRTRFAA